MHAYVHTLQMKVVVVVVVMAMFGLWAVAEVTSDWSVQPSGRYAMANTARQWRRQFPVRKASKNHLRH